MRTKAFLPLLLACFIMFTTIVFCGEVKYEDYTLSGPFSHKNLTIFLIKGKDKLSGEILSLEEALKSNKIIIYETSNVNQLAVENISDKPVFIQSGDIIKGGKQDRVLQHDFILKAKSGKIPLPSFCVEQGRWSKRGGENASSFGSSTKQLSSKRLKMAVRKDQSQHEVWEEVSVTQDKLDKNVNGDVRSSQSKSSLQLTLENKKLNKLIKEDIEVLSKKTADKKGVVGYAFAINGTINSADIYANNALFIKLWPKLIESCVTEALSERDENIKVKEVTLENMKDWLAATENGTTQDQTVGEENKVKTTESDENISFETYDSEAQEQWIHKSMIKK